MIAEDDGDGNALRPRPDWFTIGSRPAESREFLAPRPVSWKWAV